MSEIETKLTGDKYLFTFQDETQLWVPTKVIEKYRQLPFYDIIMHSDKDENNGSYYMDKLPYNMEKVVRFFMEDTIDVSSMTLQDSFDVYKTLVEYSFPMEDETLRDLLFYVKKSLICYLNDNNYDVYEDYKNSTKLRIPLEFFNTSRKRLVINGLMTPQREETLLHYSLLFKMMNVTRVYIKYQYASNIPSEYIYPTCIKDMFPSYEYFTVCVLSNYIKSDTLLNPNTDEYMMEYVNYYHRLIQKEINDDNCEYYTESEMNEYNKQSSLEIKNSSYSKRIYNKYTQSRQQNELPKLYKCTLDEAVYANDFSKVEISENIYEYTLKDKAFFRYDDEEKDKLILNMKINTELGISQLLQFPRSYPISIIENISDMMDTRNFAISIMNAFENGVFDSITTLKVEDIKECDELFDDNQFIKVITNHVFPNVTKIDYTNFKSIENFDSDFPEQLMDMIDTIVIRDLLDYDEIEDANLLDEFIYKHSLHIIGSYNDIHYFPHFKELYEQGLISLQNTIDIIDPYDPLFDFLWNSFEKQNQKIEQFEIHFTDHYSASHDNAPWSLYYYYDNRAIDDIGDTINTNNNETKKDNNDDSHYDDNSKINNDSDNDSNNNNNQMNTSETYDDYDDDDYDDYNDDDDEDNDDDDDGNNNQIELDIKDVFKRLFNSNFLQDLDDLRLIFNKPICLRELRNVASLFKDTTFNNIDYLTIELPKKDGNNKPEYFSLFKSILEKVIPKASRINIKGYEYKDIILQLIQNGCFHKATSLEISIGKISCETFLEFFTRDNFPHLKTIQISHKKRGWISPFADTLSLSVNSNKFLSSISMKLIENTGDYQVLYYNPSESILRCKSIIKYEIEIFIDCIEQHKIPNLKHLIISFCDDTYVSKIINFITSGQIPQLKECICYIFTDIPKETMDTYKQKIQDSLFIQNNHVDILFKS
ncbi:hypothetical protein WA158_005689 [Blastocystis sp. Blastoise]